MGDISMSVIVLQFVTLVICVALPSILIPVGIRKMKGSGVSLLWGILAFLAALVTYALVWSVINTIANIPRYELLSQAGNKGTVIAWETIRCGVETLIYMFFMWLFLRIVAKKHRGCGNGVLFGVGFDLLGGILVTAVSTALSLVVIFTSQSDHPIEFSFFSTAINVQNLGWARWKDVLYNIGSMITLFTVFVCCGIITYTAVDKKKFALMIVPVLLHFALWWPSRMCALTNQYRTYGIDKIWFWDNELVVVIASFLVAFIAVLAAYSIQRSHYGRAQTD